MTKRKRQGVILICPICKKEFYVKPSKKDKAKYCSEKCYGKSRKGKQIQLGKHWKVKDTSKMGGGNRGKHLSKDHRDKIGKGNKGKKIPEEMKEKLRQYKGSLASGWIDGRASLDNHYSIDWTRTLRRSIRERDHYTCQLCGAQQEDRAFSVHHIDYDKQNCNPDNLITLCEICHSKTNYKRDYWKEFFTLLTNYM